MFIKRFLSYTKEVVNHLTHKGYVFIKPGFYFSKLPPQQLMSIQKDYDFLKRDSSPGSRYRAYSRYQWDPEKKLLTLDSNNDYFQSKEYNSADGDKIRRFEPISKNYLNNAIIKKLLNKNFHIAKNTGIFDTNKNIEVGLHQIRYYATPQEPAFSSPMWLHKDDEPVVFLHLFQLSQNATGGDNIIASTGKAADHVCKLQKPLETLVVNHKAYHAVTPIATTDRYPAYRDILLVTFFHRKKPLEQKITENNNEEDANALKLQ